MEQLRQIAPYIRAHQNITLLVLLPGDIQKLSLYPTIIKDLLLLHSVGMRLITVFGARAQIADALAAKKIASTCSNGRRITTSEQMETIVSAVATMQLRQISLFNSTAQRAPLPNAATSLVWGNWLVAQPLGILQGVDYQLSGKVRKIDRQAVASLLDSGHIVAFHPLATSRLGKVLNLCCEDIVAALAQQLRPDKLIVFTRLSMLESFTKPGQHIHSSALKRVLPAIKEEWQKSLLQLAIQSCDTVNRVHIIDSEQDGALLRELFTRDGSGLMVNDNSYEQIVPANHADIAAIHELIAPMEKKGMLRPRDRLMLEESIEYFQVLKYDNAIIGSAALLPIKKGVAELCCFAVAEQYQGKGKGYTLLQAIERIARNNGVRTLIAVTTQTRDWFENHGFHLNKTKQLEKLLYSLLPERNARILVKKLGNT